jgi:hypothetical protein
LARVHEGFWSRAFYFGLYLVQLHDPYRISLDKISGVGLLRLVKAKVDQATGTDVQKEGDQEP